MINSVISQTATDLHTHSILSHDGGITAQEYQHTLESGRLHCIAVTDHNQVSFAQSLQQYLGQQIIVGEEISSKDGHIIGLFLHQRIAPGFSAQHTIKLIKDQGGIVYIPHPFEHWRSGISAETLQKVIHDMDIIELYNARGLTHDQEPKLRQLIRAAARPIGLAAGSDAHGLHGLGTAYSVLTQLPTQSTLLSLLKTAQLVTQPAPFFSRLDPFLNRTMKAASSMIAINGKHTEKP